ncbi:hypothetical protein T10_7666 [Trichinella papuae]|uniref:Uncharacterized protein n=1 Tax=Trichinella papuae TaxID=268474 RepID=A0A0V1M5X6_9BILA|nr:hypothetical protein T10_7666 [Trichinella papuae]
MRAFDSLKVALEHYLKRNSDLCTKVISLEVTWKYFQTLEQATSSVSLKFETLQAMAYNLLQRAETLLSTSEDHRSLLMVIFQNSAERIPLKILFM